MGKQIGGGMKFNSVECIYAFYDDYASDIFYQFETTPVIGDGLWAISRSGDAFWLHTEEVFHSGFPEELMELLSYIPDDIEVEGL